MTGEVAHINAIDERVTALEDQQKPINELNRNVFIITAVHDNDGVVIQEVFRDSQKALDFEKQESIRSHLLEHYGSNMLRRYNEDKVAVSFHVRTIRN